ncbi:Protein DA1 [Camellia lanceoleosa]|uniref:Protein DA1 n=1 Tax=Camellia lanceoleosa TaxID=1840588 RepID=A0ACC0GNZ4_9ERIC|nr:Protein DA1 [Camellia lanceoleosa]
MGWLSKIFKGSSHKVSEGKYNRNVGYGEDTLGREPSSSGDAWAEIEDIDRAIALSLSEEDRKSKNIVDNEYQLKDDEQLAKAIQESLNVESPPQYPQYGNENVYQPIPFPYSTGFRICAGCNTEIGHGRFLNCMGAIWHPGCFRCHGCNQPICDYEFSMSGNYPYHKYCYKEHHHPKCDVCKHFIPTNAAGLIEYRAHPFWIQKYCPFHEHDGTPRCCSCERMEPRETRYVALDDGRKVCLECLDSTIMDTNECQPLYLDIQEFYEGLNMKVEQQVPLLLVERQALNEAMDGDKSGHHHMPETRGLCLSEEQTVSTILSRPIIGTGNRAMNMITEPYTLTRRCEVTAILILYGLPRLLTGSILAHEMMHAWLRLNGYRILSQDVEEGICQVLAHMWLESQIMSMSGSNVASTSSSAPVLTLSKQGTRSPFERKLGEFFKHQIESDTSPVYGNGFRAGNQAVLKYGLWTTLEHIRLTGTFPY